LPPAFISVAHNAPKVTLSQNLVSSAVSRIAWEC